MKMQKKNLLIVHGGGPTMVMNSSLFGAIQEAKKHSEVEHIYGAVNGTGGVLNEHFIELEKIPECELELLLQTPGSAIGTSRDPLSEESYKELADILVKHNIGWVLLNGGNGTMDTCGKLFHTCKRMHLDIACMGIPKTTDNDLALTDHSPGYGSAARFIAQSVREVSTDVQALPIHVVIIEASGRNAGWITAASALAGEDGQPGPDLIYLPERNFVPEKFLEDVRRLLAIKRGIVVVCSEGLHDEKGNPIVPPIFTSGRATYFGDVSSHLANLVIKELGYKARGEKPGLLGRCSCMTQSLVDREEAVQAGKEACRLALKKESGKMIAFRRITTDPYRVFMEPVPIEKVMMYERKMSDEMINAAGNGVTESFLNWCRPLIGGPLTKMIHFN